MEQNHTIICRCEEVTLGDLITTVETFQCSARELKLRTRAGMGYCGGRTCRQLIDRLTQYVTSQAPGNQIPLGYQPPVRPISFKLLGEADNEQS